MIRRWRGVLEGGLAELLFHMAAALASLNIFCSFVASVSRRFCRNSARVRRKRATLLGPSMLGVLRTVPGRAVLARACGGLRAVHKRAAHLLVSPA